MDDPRDKFSLLIPAYLRGELSAIEVQRLEAAAKTDPEIAADIAFQRQLRQVAEHDKPPADGWNRLQAAMQSESSGEEIRKPALALVTSNDAVDETKSYKAANSNERGGVNPFWRIAAVALAVAGIGHVALTPTNEVPQDIYLTASESQSVAQASLKIGFSDEAKLQDVTELFQNNDGEIISGPSSLGLYTIGYESMESCRTDIDRLSMGKNSALIETLSSCE